MYSRLSVWLSVPSVPSLPSPGLVAIALCIYSRQCISVHLSDRLSVPSVFTIDCAPAWPTVHPPCLPDCLCPLYVPQYMTFMGIWHSLYRSLSYISYISVICLLDVKRGVPVITTIWYISFDLTSRCQRIKISVLNTGNMWQSFNTQTVIFRCSISWVIMQQCM